MVYPAVVVQCTQQLNDKAYQVTEEIFFKIAFVLRGAKQQTDVIVGYGVVVVTH